MNNPIILSKKIVAFLKQILYYPLILALYPLLLHYSNNVRYVHHSLIFRTLKISIPLSFLFLIIVNYYIKNKHSAALYITVLILMFYSYGSNYMSLIYLFNFNWDFLAHGLSVFFIIIAIASWIVLSNINIKPEITSFLNVFSIVLVALALTKITQYQITRQINNNNNLQEFSKTEYSASLDYLPDIYYIVLDSHARSDVLLNEYDYDDSEFKNQLNDLGFYIGNCSQTNYWRTEYAISAALNMDYLPSFVKDPNILPEWKYSKVRQLVDSLGYTTISFDGRAAISNNLNFSEEISIKTKNDFSILSNINQYETQIVYKSWLRYWLVVYARATNSLPENSLVTFTNIDAFAYPTFHDDPHFITSQLKEIPLQYGEPKFVFAHILVPHFPFIYTEDGQYDFTNKDHVLGFKNGAIFIDNKMIEVTKAILDRSERPPIIIIQGDHGRHFDSLENLMPIFNAYYLPEGGNQSLYDTISPVNSFRAVFNYYFSADFPLLEDKSYFAKNNIFVDPDLVPNFCEVK